MTSKGFFQIPKSSSRIPRSRIPRCGECGLYKSCQHPKMKLTGRGQRGILIVAEAPGAIEDEKGIQLVGPAGIHLRKMMKGIGLDLDRDCWKTNAVVCRPPKNQTPTDMQIQACRPNLYQAIEKHQPKVIVLMGMSAIKSLLGPMWGSDMGSMGRWIGWNIPSPKPNAWIVPTYHPSYLIRMKDPVLDRMVTQHLKAAVRRSKDHPNPVGTYEDCIHIIRDSRKASRWIQERMNPKFPIAFDYETNSLKPEGERTEIVTCSVAISGSQVVAFPWQGKVVETMSHLLRSGTPKIASNLKFEDRWTHAKLGHGVRGWLWDTMLASHVLDNRPGITSIKFQAFVQLGVLPYDTHIAPYLKSRSGSSLNRIRELDMKDLLYYNAMDSLLEYLIAQKQMKVLSRRRPCKR